MKVILTYLFTLFGKGFYVDKKYIVAHFNHEWLLVASTLASLGRRKHNQEVGGVTLKTQSIYCIGF